jgi:lipopolysaccharide/colanic/teichoic acid biosynthesis glycosyltransferase
VGPAWTPDAAAAPEALAGVALRPFEEIEVIQTPRTRRALAGWSPAYAFSKRAFDLVVSLFMLTVGLPLFAAVALAILIADGRPIFYGHVRQTRGGRPFRCWKFRTMCRDAEKLKDLYLDRDVCDGPQVFIRHDPRITNVGHVLRRFQIDEAPQFLNVLLGQMSIVGPRPSPDEENQYCPAWRELRLSMRPGITGLWQLRRTRAPGHDFQEWIRYDIEYARRASFWFDLAICLRTAWVLLAGRRTTCA